MARSGVCALGAVVLAAAAASKRNGGKDLAALVKHVSADPSVLWGWSPGFGRAPVPVPDAKFARAFKAVPTPARPAHRRSGRRAVRIRR